MCGGGAEQEKERQSPRLLQPSHLRRKDQSHAAAAGIAVENCGAIQIILKRALLVRGFADIQQYSIRADAAENSVPGSIDDGLIGARIEPSIANAAQHGGPDHRRCRKFLVGSRDDR